MTKQTTIVVIGSLRVKILFFKNNNPLALHKDETLALKAQSESTSGRSGGNAIHSSSVCPAADCLEYSAVVMPCSLL